MSNKILVIGGTGKTGRKVVQRLEKLKQSVRVGSRAGSPAFDWENPTSWSEALNGMEMVYITFQPDLAVPGAVKAIKKLTEVAKTAGVKKLVLLSGKGEHEAELCEQVIVQSGINHTILRATWFNQNFSESFFLDPILAGHVALPQAEAKVPYIDTDDIADMVVEVLLDHKHNRMIYELTGTRSLTFRDVVKEISIATDRQIEFTPVDIDTYVDMLEAHGVPEDYRWLVRYLFTEVLGSEQVSEMSNDIEKVLGRKPKDFSTYAQETAATGVWNQSVKQEL